MVAADSQHSSRVDAETLVQRAAVELEEKGLLEGRLRSRRISRRHALRRMAGVGAAAIAAPLVVSAAVPKSAEAAGSPTTCISETGACTTTNTANSRQQLLHVRARSNSTATRAVSCQTCIRLRHRHVLVAVVATTATKRASCCSGTYATGTRPAQQVRIPTARHLISESIRPLAAVLSRLLTWFARR